MCGCPVGLMPVKVICFNSVLPSLLDFIVDSKNKWPFDPHRVGEVSNLAGAKCPINLNFTVILFYPTEAYIFK